MAVLGLHLSPELDVTGIATALLAIATAYLALRTRDAVKQGSVELERANRPVLVPYIDRTVQIDFRDPTGEALADFVWPLAPAALNGTAWVPVSNVGMGPALHVRATISFGDVDGRPSTHGIDTTCKASAAAIAHSRPYSILAFRDTQISGMTGFTFELNYEDVAGKAWRTAGRYSHRERTFVDIEIVEPSF